VISPRTVEITEHFPTYVPGVDLPEELMVRLHTVHGKKIKVEPPSFITGGRWKLVSLGWVGSMPLSSNLRIRLKPKVPLSNLFGMLEVAYRFRGIEFLKGLSDCKTLEEYYERLAHILALKVLDRWRKGLYREYVPKDERLPYVRGRLELSSVVRRPWEIALDCRFEEHTPDVTHNQAILWALHISARSGQCSDRTMPTVGKAYRSLQGAVSRLPTSARDCLTYRYNRLNEDYRPLHALARFLIDLTGPDLGAGGDPMLPFLVEMPRLYELFVAEWLRYRLPDRISVKTQYRRPIGLERHFTIDLLLVDSESGSPLAVLDTKYKAQAGSPDADIFQVVTYAESVGCRNAILVSPAPRGGGPAHIIGRKKVHRISFPLEGNLDQAGETFLQDLLATLG
jgi:5-methylcytosine-specific restriction enzyme subunit McrC